MSQVTMRKETKHTTGHVQHASAQPDAAPRSSLVRGWFSWTPTVAVVAALCALGYWGHVTHWKMTGLGGLFGAGEPATESAAWCDEHNVPEEECVECRPTILPAPENSPWCKEHGVQPCPLCHPEVIQTPSTPTISPAEFDRVSQALALRKRSENTNNCPLNFSRVQFASSAAVEKSGIDIDVVTRKPVVEAIEANGEIVYDRTRLARLSSRVKGSVWRVEKHTGDVVKRGDVLALIDAAEVGQEKSRLLEALANCAFYEEKLGLLRPLAAEEIIPRNRLLEAETALEQARIKQRQAQQSLINLGFKIDAERLAEMPPDRRAAEVQFLGLPKSIRDSLDTETTTSNLLPLTAPLDGLVIDRDAVAGEVVDTEKTLFELADTSRMWLVFNVAMEDARFLKQGQTVEFLADGSPQTVNGNLNWISTDVNRQTRTVTVRANLENPDGRLRNETFGLGKIILREDSQAVVVPSKAVQWDGNCHVVFVRDKDYFEEGRPKIFYARQVRLGAKQDGFTEIIAGVWLHEVVVTEGSSVLRSQLLKGNLGAGCTCGH